MRQTHTVTIFLDKNTHTVRVNHGANLRQVLLENGFTPYATVTKRLNCGGRGLCATCGVWIENGEPSPQHWHDLIGSRFGYPRLSCQITIEADMAIRILTDKWIWGRREPQRAFKPDKN